MNLQPMLETAVLAARAGAQELDSYFREGHVESTLKGEDDFVSNADHASERAILRRIRRAHPDHAILAEESGSLGTGSSPFSWVIDPLDGTRNFIRGLPIFAVSIACLHQGRPVVGVVLDPQRDELYQATAGGGAYRDGQRLAVSDATQVEGSFLATGYPFRHGAALELYLALFRRVLQRARGVRRCGAAALDLAHTAAGVFDGFFEFCLSAWDLAAGVLLIEEAGGVVSDLDGGQEYLSRGNVVAGAPELWRDLQALVATEVDEAAIRHVLTKGPAAASDETVALTGSVT